MAVVSNDFLPGTGAAKQYTPETPGPSVFATAGAASRIGIDVVNAFGILTRKEFQKDQDFIDNRFEVIKQRYPKLVQNPNYHSLARTNSFEELEYVKARIDKQVQDRETLHEAGSLGVVLEIGAGLISPTNYIPLIGIGARGFKAAGQGAAYVGLATALQEAVLQGNQETRTYGESITGIGAGMVLGALLGPAAGRFAGRRLEKVEALVKADLEDFAVDMGVDVSTPKTVPDKDGTPEGGGTVTEPPAGLGTGQAGSAGAAVTEVAPQGTKGIFGSNKKFGIGKVSFESLGPVSRQANSVISYARWVMGNIADGGLLIKSGSEGRVVAQGGTIESLRAGWSRGLAKGLTELDGIYGRYVFDGKPPAVFSGPRAFIAGARNPQKFSQEDFNKQVSRYMRDGEKWEGSPNPDADKAIKEAGDLLRKEVYEPMFDQMKFVGLLPEDVKTVADVEYLNRVYNLEAIRNDTNKFTDILVKNFLKKRKEAFLKESESLRLKELDLEQRVADNELDAATAKESIKVLREELARLNDSDNPVQSVLNEITDLKKRIKNGEKESEITASLQKELDDLNALHRRDVQVLRDEKGKIRTRLNGINQNINLLESKRQAFIRKYERMDEMQLGSLMRLERAWSVFQRNLSMKKWNPEEIEKAYEDILEKLGKTEDLMTKNEANMRKMEGDDKGETAKYFKQATMVYKRVHRIKALRERLDLVQKAGDDAAIRNQLLAEGHEKLRVDIKELNQRRTARQQVLVDKIKELDPKLVQDNLAQAEVAMKEKKDALIERWHKLGFEDIDFGDLQRTAFEKVNVKRLQEYIKEIGSTDTYNTSVIQVVPAKNKDLVRNDPNRVMGDVSSSEGFHDELQKFDTADDYLKWAMVNSTIPGFKELARRFIGNTVKAPLLHLKAGDVSLAGWNFQSADAWATPFYKETATSTGVKATYLGASISVLEDGVTERTLMHEVIHVTTLKRTLSKDLGGGDGWKKMAQLKSDIHNELPNLDKDMTTWVDSQAGMTKEQKEAFKHNFSYFWNAGKDATSPVAHFELETLTVALTDQFVQEFLKSIKLPKTNQTLWSKFVGALAEAFGIKAGDEYTAFSRVLEITDELSESALSVKAIEDMDFFNPKLASAVDVGAREIAEKMTQKILGAKAGRLSNWDLLDQEQRGSELERVLDIPSNDFSDAGFLEDNIEKLMRAYVRTIAPDIEIMRKFGTIDMQKLLGGIHEEAAVLLRAARGVGEKKQVIKELEEALAGEVDQGKKGILKNQLLSVKKGLTTKEINAAVTEAIDDFTGVIGRLRHTHGVPDNPTGWAARGARIAMNVNTLRLMGMVAISSIPDLARLVMYMGPMRAYKSGLKPLVSNFSTLKVSLREAQLAGTALDVVLHTRMYEIMNMMDDAIPVTKFERGLETMTSKIGIVSGFDYWNTAMKTLASQLFNAETLDAIQSVVEASHKGAKPLKKAQEHLARLNIDGQTSIDIWRLVENGGGSKVGDVWLPNTDDWVKIGDGLGMNRRRVESAVRIYRQALVHDVDMIVVTPGLERPLWMDGSIAGKLIGQFRSFTFSSTYKTTMAGLQQNDSRFALGSAVSLGLGALSYKLWGVMSGYDTSEDDWEKWADEMIDRSGLIGAFSEVRRLGQTVPWLNDYVMVSGQQSTRYGGMGGVSSTFGPSVDLAQTFFAALNGMSDPTEGTARMMRKLMPYQNVWWGRRLFDELIEGLDLPKDRR